jgi:hypothetical protein
MLSGKLVHLIEAHQQEITDRLIREIHHHPDLTHLRHISEAELRDRSQTLLENLGYWLAADNEDELAKTYEGIGKSRLESGVPLHEAVHALCIVKDKMIDFVDEQGIPTDALSLYAEEELEHRVSRFFDVLIIHMIRGYESARGRAAHHAA